MKTKTYFSLLLIVSFSSCTFLKDTGRKHQISYSIQAGTNKGGITENTDLSLVPNVRTGENQDIDAFSGASLLGIHAGLHAHKQLKKNELESGLVFMNNHQIFQYSDEGNGYSGERFIRISQVMIPFSYNIHLLKRMAPETAMKFKIGFVGQMNFTRMEDTGIVPDYSIRKFSAGLSIGLSAFLFQFKNGQKLGIYIDGYRGSQLYEDLYNQPEFEMPGSSYVKVGLSYQFKSQ